MNCTYSQGETVTHTCAILEVSPQAYADIRLILQDTGYADRIGDGFVIDLDGLAIRPVRMADTSDPELEALYESFDTHLLLERIDLLFAMFVKEKAACLDFRRSHAALKRRLDKETL